MPWQDSAPHLQNHPGQEPVQAANAVPPLVVCWDADIDVSHGRVSVTEGNGRDVPQSRLLDGLVVGPWVGEDEQAGLAEGGLHLVGEGTRGVPPGDGVGAGVLRELEDGALAVGAGGLDDDVLGVLDGDDDPRRELELLPCLAQIDDVDAVGAALVGVALHLEVAVLGAEVDVGGEHHLYVLLLLGQRPRGLSSRCRHGWSGTRASGGRREGEEEEGGM